MDECFGFEITTDADGRRIAVFADGSFTRWVLGELAGELAA